MVVGLMDLGAMADFAKGKMQMFVGPIELGAADNPEQSIVDVTHSRRIWDGGK
jgi:hypothetical protein